jgi:hypothetical protein
MPLIEPHSSIRFPEGSEALDMARVGLKAFARMAEHWDLTLAQQRLLLGGMAKTTYYGLLKGTMRCWLESGATWRSSSPIRRRRQPG